MSLMQENERVNCEVLLHQHMPWKAIMFFSWWWCQQTAWWCMRELVHSYAYNMVGTKYNNIIQKRTGYVIIKITPRWKILVALHWKTRKKIAFAFQLSRLSHANLWAWGQPLMSPWELCGMFYSCSTVVFAWCWHMHCSLCSREGRGCFCFLFKKP